MYLDHRVTVKIARVLNMIDFNAFLLDVSGNVIYPEGDTRSFSLPDALLQNPTMPLVYGSVTLIGTHEESPVFICLHGDSEEIKKCAVLCAELINQMLHEDMVPTSRDQVLRMVLRGEVDPGEVESVCIESGLSVTDKHCVIYVYLADTDAESAIRKLKEIKGEDEEFYTEVGRHAVAIIKRVESDDQLQMVEEYAKTVAEMFESDNTKAAIIGISDTRDGVIDLEAAYEEAREAINVGHVYQPERKIFCYRNLLLERFLDGISVDTGMRYNAMIFNRKTARLFNEEMVHTIEAFFENSLNLSETARKLYIHRNTLVYRLEKVQKAIGLDLRNFDDAVTFKMMLLLGKNNGAKRSKL